VTGSQKSGIELQRLCSKASNKQPIWPDFPHSSAHTISVRLSLLSCGSRLELYFSRCIHWTISPSVPPPPLSLTSLPGFLPPPRRPFPVLSKRPYRFFFFVPVSRTCSSQISRPFSRHRSPNARQLSPPRHASLFLFPPPPRKSEMLTPSFLIQFSFQSPSFSFRNPKPANSAILRFHTQLELPALYSYSVIAECRP